MAQSNTKLLTRSSLRAIATALCVGKLRVLLSPHGHMSRSATSDGFKVKSNLANISHPQNSREHFARYVVPPCSMLPSKRIKTPSVWHWARYIVIRAANPCATSWLVQKLLGLKSPTICLSQRKHHRMSSAMPSNTSLKVTLRFATRPLARR